MLTTENPDRVLVAEAIAAAAREVAVETNPVCRDLAAVLELAEAGRVTFRFEAAPRHTQGANVVHGGLIATMLDTGMAYAALSMVAPGQSVASVSLSVSYLKAGQPGPLRVTAEIEQAGKRLIFAKAALRDADGRLLATAASPYAVLTIAAKA